MKRSALLIGNSNGLPGVKLDLANFKKFLMNEIGGKWFESEILTEMNPSKKFLQYRINEIKNSNPDYVIVMYSGHGGYHRETLLEINDKGETINESELRGIASRQLLIFDCCRNVIKLSNIEEKSFSSMNSLFKSSDQIRYLYDKRIMGSIEQQASLYSCSVGESSYDTNDGGIYTTSLLSSVIPDSSSQFKLVSISHSESCPKTTKKAFELYSKKQYPDHSLPKCLSSQQLIISINPNFNKNIL